MIRVIQKLAADYLVLGALVSICLQIAGTTVLYAAENRVFQCATSEDIYEALDAVEPGDTIMLEGGRVYEIAESLELRASGSAGSRISLTSEDGTGRGRYAVISTVGGRKEPDLVAVRLTGSYWNVSRIEITGKKVPLDEGYWDTNGFRLGIYLLGPGAHHNVIEDVHIHHTHNAAVAVRDRSHHNTFRLMTIHHIGEWLHEDFNAHTGEGFYIGSSKGIAEAGDKARAHDILIEDSILGPGLLGQYVDIKYAASSVVVRRNVFYCDERSYNQEVVKLAGFANVIEDNEFIGSNGGLAQYVLNLDNSPDDPVKVDYLGNKNIPAPAGRDNTVVNNVFYTDDTGIRIVKNDLSATDRSSIRLENNRIEALDDE